MQQKQILIDWQIITYLVSTDFDKNNAILFLHGRWHDKYSFQNILKFCEDEKQSFLSIDFPWFGQSPQPKTDWHISDYAKLVKDFLSKLSIDKINIVAHSFGGRVAIYLTAQNMFKISKLILIASWGIKPKTNHLRLFIIKFFKTFSQILPKSLQQVLQSKVRSIDYQSAGWMSQIFLNTINLDLAPILHKIRVPTKLIWGTDDDQTPINDAYTMYRGIANSKLFVIEWWSHYIHMEKPELVRKETKKFLSENN